MKKLFVATFLTAIILTGCMTPYQQVGFTGGFTEKQVSRNEFTVGFYGNGYTTGQRAVDMCMLRCAELALGHGFHYFVLTDNRAGYDTSTSITTGNYVSTGYGNGFFFSSTQQIFKPGAVNRILCFKEKPTSFDNYFDAQDEYGQLSQKYGVNKPPQKFQKFTLPIAALGITLNAADNHPVLKSVNTPTPIEEGHIKVQSFLDGSQAPVAGIQLGDEIKSVDGTPVTNLDNMHAAESTWKIGQMVQVGIRRNGEDLIIPVKTIFNPILRFKVISSLKMDEVVSENDVTVIEDSRPKVACIPVASYVDWEMPVDTDSELQHYLVSAAINRGVNGVLILTSRENVDNVFQNADDKIGFACQLLIIPKARIGVEFETGTGYENRRVIRRVLNPEPTGSGFQIGDNILSINGIDPVSNALDAEKDSMIWEVGQDIQVTVARGGAQLSFYVKTIENKP